MPCEESYFSREDILIAVLNFTLTISIVFINGFILFVVAHNWKQINLSSNNKSSVYLTINLCVADLYMGLLDFYFSLPLYVCSLARYLGHHEVACIFRFVLIISANTVSGYTLVIIAVERYIYVVHALKYSTIMSPRRTMRIIAMVWTVGFLCTCPLFFWNCWDDNAGTCGDVDIVPVVHAFAFTVTRIFLVVIVITVFHWLIHRTALKVHTRNEPEAAVSGLKTRSARVVLVVCVVYLISWIPFTVTFLCLKYDVYVPPMLHKLFCSLIDVCYVVNPFIYAYNNRAIGTEIRNTLRTFRYKCKSLFSRVPVTREGTVSSNATSDTSNISGRTTFTLAYNGTIRQVDKPS